MRAYFRGRRLTLSSLTPRYLRRLAACSCQFMKLTGTILFDWLMFDLLACSTVGVVFGSYPAIKAANVDPIESLRYE